MIVLYTNYYVIITHTHAHTQLVDLKAALFQKQQQVKQEKQTSFDSAQPNKSVSDKVGAS